MFYDFLELIGLVLMSLDFFYTNEQLNKINNKSSNILNFIKIEFVKVTRKFNEQNISFLFSFVPIEGIVKIITISLICLAIVPIFPWIFFIAIQGDINTLNIVFLDSIDNVLPFCLSILFFAFIIMLNLFIVINLILLTFWIYSKIIVNLKKHILMSSGLIVLIIVKIDRITNLTFNLSEYSKHTLLIPMYNLTLESTKYTIDFYIKLIQLL